MVTDSATLPTQLLKTTEQTKKSLPPGRLNSETWALTKMPRMEAEASVAPTEKEIL